MPRRTVALTVTEGAWEKFHRMYPEVSRNTLCTWIMLYGLVEDEDVMRLDCGRDVILRHNYKIDLPFDNQTDYYVWPDDNGILYKEFDV